MDAARRARSRSPALRGCRGVAADGLTKTGLHGFVARPLGFEPTFHKHETYEFVDDIPALDILVGSAEAHERIEVGEEESAVFAKAPLRSDTSFRRGLRDAFGELEERPAEQRKLASTRA